MRIHILSDIHLEEHGYTPEPTDADVVVLAGDIGVGIEGVLWAKEHFQVPVIYVAGNHEYHDPTFSMDEHREMMKQVADGSNVVVLDNAAVEIEGVRFLGATLWSDVQEFGAVLHCDQDSIAVSHDPDAVSEHFAVDVQQGLFEHSRNWLKRELSDPFGGKTIVVTHHAPSARSIHAQHDGNPWNACFVSDMEALMEDVDLWVHGHTHSCFDYRIGDARVVCNPRGYANPLGGWENRAFDPAKVIVI